MKVAVNSKGSVNRTTSKDNTTKKNKIVFSNLTKKQKEAITAGSIGFAGLVAGAGIYEIMGFAKSNEHLIPISDEDVALELGTTVAEMNAEVADKATETTVESTDTNIDAATEVLSATEAVEVEIVEEAFEVTIYTDAPVSVIDNNAMVFDQAFEAARADVGPGGVFSWNGDLYNTYTKEEWDNMSSDQHAQFSDSITNDAEYFAEEIEYDLADVEVVDPVYVVDENEVLVEIDTDADGTSDIFLVDIDDNDTIDIVMDQNNDGVIDEVILDYAPESHVVNHAEDSDFATEDLDIEEDVLDIDDLDLGDDLTSL